MNKLALLLPLLLLFGCSGSSLPESYQADDSRIQILGRHTVKETGAVSFGASGVTFYFKFRGPKIEVVLEDEFRDSTSYNWFTVTVDGESPSRFRTHQGKRIYTLADSLSSGTHTVALSKASEGQNGWNKLVEVRTPKLLQADELPERKIEFIGNSITCGYGLDASSISCGEGTWFAQHHAWLAYGPRLARRLEAQWMLSSVSGMGMHRNWNSPGPVMPDIYQGVYMDYQDSTSQWNFDRYKPDLVVIALGTNDFSEGDGETPRKELDGDAFVNDYTQFAERVRGRYPNAQFLLLNSPVFESGKKRKLESYLERVIQNRKADGDSSLSLYTFAGRYTEGCDGHPGKRGHQQMADSLEPVIRKMMGW